MSHSTKHTLKLLHEDRLRERRREEKKLKLMSAKKNDRCFKCPYAWNIYFCHALQLKAMFIFRFELLSFFLLIIRSGVSNTLVISTATKIQKKTSIDSWSFSVRKQLMIKLFSEIKAYPS